MLAAILDGTTTTIDPNVAVAQEQSGTVTLVLLAVLVVTTLVVLRRVRRIRRTGTARPR